MPLLLGNRTYQNDVSVVGALLSPGAGADSHRAFGGNTGAYINSLALGQGAQGRQSSVALGGAAENLGNNSVAVGYGAYSQSDSVQIGNGGWAAGTNRVAIGQGSGNNSTSNNSVCVGYISTARTVGAIAIGYDAEVESGAQGGGIAIGETATVGASVGAAIAIGKGSWSPGSRAVAIGGSATGGSSDVVAIGINANAGGAFGVAIGGAAVASQSMTIAVGSSCYAQHTAAITIGTNSRSRGNWAVGIGFSVDTGAASVAVGYEADAYALDSVVVGTEAYARLAQNATALITFAAGVADGDTFTVRAADVPGTDIVFEFDSDSSVVESPTLRQIVIAGGESADALRDLARIAVNAAPINMSAADGAGTGELGLTQGLAGKVGNTVIDDNSTFITPVDFSGGQEQADQAVAVGRGADAQDAVSVAVGYNALVGLQSVALGPSSSALGTDSVAIGHLASAQGLRTVAIGKDCHDSPGGQNNVLIGEDTWSSTSTTDAVAIGQSIFCNAGQTVMIGRNADAKYRGVTIGYAATASNAEAITIGNSAHTTATGAIAIGYLADANFDGSIAIGKGADVTGTVGAEAIAIGLNADATWDYNIAIGGGAQAGGNQTVAIGRNAVAGSGTNRVLIGNTATVSGNNSIVIGYGASTSGRESSIIGGSVTGGANQFVAVFGQGATVSGHQCTIVGQAASATTNAVAVGKNSSATGSGTVAVGHSSLASSTDAIALGRNSIASSSYVIGIGENAGAGAGHIGAIGIGRTAGANGGTGAIAIGYQSNANSSSGASMAVGSGASVAGGSNAIALGASALSSAAGAVSLGYDSTASHAGSVAIGINSVTTLAAQCMLGASSDPLNLYLHGYYAVPELSTPPSGAEAGYGKIYAKADTKPYFLDSAGVEHGLLTTASGGSGWVRVTDILAQGGGNISNQTYQDPGADTIIQTAETSTLDVRIVIEASYPLVVVDGNPATLTKSGSMYTGTVDITIAGSGPVVTQLKTADDEDGAVDTVNITYVAPPELLTLSFTGGYPGSQTELKAGDTFQITGTTDVDANAVEVQDFGASDSVQLLTFPEGTSFTVTMTIGDRGTTVQDLAARVRARNADLSFGATRDTNELGGTTDGVDRVKLNNLYPSGAIGVINYPASQSALKGVEGATVNHTAADYDTIAYTDPTTSQITIANPSTFEAAKSVTCQNPGLFNNSTTNFRYTMNRAANDADTEVNGVVVVADIAAVITVTEATARVRSGAGAGADTQITISSDQPLFSAPSMDPAVGRGTFQGSWAGGPSVWTRNLRVTDAENPKDDSLNTWINLSATNLANTETTVITGNDTYIVGGFTPRTINFAAFTANSTETFPLTQEGKLSAGAFSNGNPAVVQPFGTPDTTDIGKEGWCAPTAASGDVNMRMLHSPTVSANSGGLTLTLVEETV